MSGLLKRFCCFVSDKLNPFDNSKSDFELEIEQENKRLYRVIEKVLPTMYCHELRKICKRLGIPSSYLNTKEELVSRIMEYIEG